MSHMYNAPAFQLNVKVNISLKTLLQVDFFFYKNITFQDVLCKENN